MFRPEGDRSIFGALYESVMLKLDFEGFQHDKRASLLGMGPFRGAPGSLRSLARQTAGLSASQFFQQINRVSEIFGDSYRIETEHASWRMPEELVDNRARHTQSPGSRKCGDTEQ